MADQSVVTELLLNAQQFIAEAQRAARAGEEIGKKSEKATEPAKKGFAGAAQSAQKYQKELTGVGLLMTGAGAASTALSVAVARVGIEYNLLQQSSRAALSTVLGSTKAANAQMDELDKWAKTSPFAKQTFIQAQQQMLAFGVETKRVIPILDAVQQSVAAMGGSNTDIAQIVDVLSKIQSQGKITARELMQLGIHGIDAAQLIGNAMGKTANEIRTEITAGALDADTALTALAEGMQARFGGAADNVKNTMVGSLDRVKAAVRDFSSSAMEPFVGIEGGGLFVTWLNQAADMLRLLDKLPGPMKTATVTAGGLGGAMLTFAGSMLLAAPRLANLKDDITRLSTAFPRLATSMKVTGIAGGALSAALVAAGVGFAIYNAHAAESLARTEALASVMQATGDATNLATNDAKRWTMEQIAMNRVDWGWAQRGATGMKNLGEALDATGISAREMTDAVHGTADEADAFRNMIQQEIDADPYGDLSMILQQVGIKFEQLRTSAENAVEANERMAEGSDDAADSLDGVAGSAGSAAEGVDEAAAAYEKAEAATKRYADALAGLIDLQNREAQAANNAINTERDWINARAALTESIEKNGSTLDQNTEAGQTNMKAWQDLVKASSDYVTAAIDNGDAADIVAAKWESARASLAELGTQLDMGDRQVLDFAHELGWLTDQDYELLLKLHVEGEDEAAALHAELDGIPAEVHAHIRALGGDEAVAVAGMVEAAIEAGVPPERLTRLGALDEATDMIQLVQVEMDAYANHPGTAHLKAVDHASGVIKPVQDQIDYINVNQWIAKLTGQDINASSVAHTVKTTVEDATKPKTVTMSAVDKASPTIRDAISLLNSFQSKTITLTTNVLTRNSGSTQMGQQVPGAASGGAIQGPGTTTSDSILYRLSNDEHVWTARETSLLGGHGAMYALRQMARENPYELRDRLGFAGGGTPAGTPIYVPSPLVAPAVSNVVVQPAPVKVPDVKVTAFVESPWDGKETQARVRKVIHDYDRESGG